MSTPEWNQPIIERKLNPELYEILKITMGYVDEAWKIEIEPTLIEQKLQDIANEMERLATEIEEGKYRKENGI